MFRTLRCISPLMRSFIDLSIGISAMTVSRVRPLLTSSKVVLPRISMGPSSMTTPKAWFGSYSTTSIVPSTGVPERLLRLWIMVPKTLSENRQVEQHVGAGQLDQCQPVLRLLGPASTQAATLDEPGDRPLHHPSPRRMRLPMRVLLL